MKERIKIIIQKLIHHETVQKYVQKIKSNWVFTPFLAISLIGTSGFIVFAEESADEVEVVEAVEAEEKAEEKQEEKKETPEPKEDEKATDESSEPDEEESSDSFIMPAEGEVSSEYGHRIHPIYQVEKLHAGIDIAGGGPIKAVQEGKVVEAGWDAGWGNYVKIDHGEGVETLYAHMQHDSVTVSAGDTVSQEEQIGTMGTTGASTGVHLHFEIYQDGEITDPAPYLPL